MELNESEKRALAVFINSHWENFLLNSQDDLTEEEAEKLMEKLESN